MNRTAGALLLLAGLGGCMSMDHGSEVAPWSQNANCVGSGCGGHPPTIPGAQGPWGQPVAMAAPYSSAPSMAPGTMAAYAMMNQSVPLDMVQRAGYNPAAGQPSGIIPASTTCPPGGCVPGMITPPGVPGMPGMPGMVQQAGHAVPGAVAAAGVGAAAAAPCNFPAQRTEVRFVGPPGMKISWFAPCAGGKGGFTSENLEAPARYNFSQAAIYRLKLSDLPNRPGLDMYPTLEVVPTNQKTASFLAHAAVPVLFTEEDFDQVTSGNYVVKVIYLPNPQFQEIATTGLGEVVSSRLEPGADPLVEAHRRGSILLVIRLGNIDLEAPNTPAMDAPNSYANKPPMPPPGAAMPGQGMPYAMDPNAGGGPGMPYGMNPNMGGMGPMQNPYAAGGFNPAAPPNQLPPASTNMPTFPGAGAAPPANPGVSQGSSPNAVQTTQYKSVTAAETAGQPADAATDTKKKDTRERRSLFGWGK